MGKTYNARDKLIKYRKNKQLTQEQISKLLKISRASYANYETGFRTPKLKTAIEIKKILEIDDDNIFLN